MTKHYILLFIPIVSSLVSKYPFVHTPYGAVRGYEFEASNGFVGEIFKKIPFASPPSGNRRWKKPEPPETWDYTIDGTFAGPACAQADSSWAASTTGISEDCLTLNVYTSKQCRESKACPVLVYIHGGSGLFGSSINFPDDHIVSKYTAEGVILVTISYRLGVFGISALGDEHAMPANLAVHDVVQSLRFVQQTIHAFGGDKEHVSIMGHSFGATIVLFLVYSPAMNKAGDPPLFSRAISISAFMNFENEEKQVDRTHGVATHLGCKGTAQEIVNCLQPLTTEQILRAASEVGGGALKFYGIIKAGELYPVRDLKELRENQQAHMAGLAPAPPTKLMIGTQLNEFRREEFLYWYEANVINGTVIETLDALGVRNYEECSNKYMDDFKSGLFQPEYDRLSQCIMLSASLFASEQARAGGEVYLYQYDYFNHSDHTNDLYFLMGVHDFPLDENEKWLSRVYPVYFTNFIKGLPLAPDWKPLDPNLMNYYSINKSFVDGVVPQMKFGYHQPITDYYLDLQKFDENLSNIKQLKATAPIKFNSLVLLSTKSFNLRDVIVYSVFVVLFLLFVLRLVQCCRNSRRRAGYISLKSDL